MRQCSSKQFLSAALVLCLSLLHVEASTNLAPVGAIEKVTFEIPCHLSAGDDLLRKFKAVSSHGRSDALDGAAPMTYTTFQIYSRAVYLLIVFAPMMCTSGLAFIFSWFRNGIWFQLLRFGISQGGAVRIFDCWNQSSTTMIAALYAMLSVCVTYFGNEFIVTWITYLYMERNNRVIYMCGTFLTIK